MRILRAAIISCCCLAAGRLSAEPSLVLLPRDVARFIVLSKQPRDDQQPGERYQRLESYLRTLIAEGGYQQLRIRDWEEFGLLLEGVAGQPCASEHPEYIAKTAQYALDRLLANQAMIAIVDRYGVPVGEKFPVLLKLESLCRHLEDAVTRKLGQFPAVYRPGGDAGEEREIWAAKWALIEHMNDYNRDFMLRQPSDGKVQALAAEFDRKLAALTAPADKDIALLVEGAIADFKGLTKDKWIEESDEAKELAARRRVAQEREQELRALAQRLDRKADEPLSAKTKALEAEYQKTKKPERPAGMK